ncbi:Ca2+-binding protein, EF-hand superfamily [Glycomyces sambucus]|uniref:Ca2+-binding protein, EF-hand superfamily n=1 Tax=Glycomyces sambucus TaxID=380244 RepID=A0A1G9I8C5_9ACTN|nr:lipase family protein [Glycomyces sambucus]SDL21489.1 Ca2+-binding protein, EF-hand superfamily [Glycomyces sambucus]
MTWAPGALVRHRPLPRRFWPDEASAAHRIFYRGFGYDGERRLVSGSAFLPAGRAPGSGWPVVAFAHGTTGLSNASAPSRSGFSRLERDHIGRWLAAGYAVAATDYEGLATPGPHPYFNGEAVADDVVDAVRALRGLGHPIADAWLVAGFSQGGHAAMHVANIATGYAPELDFRGTIALAPAACVADLVAHLTADGAGPLSPITILTLAGVAVTHPDFDVADTLTPVGAALVSRAAGATLRDMFRAVRGLTNDAAGTTGVAAVPDVAEVLAAVSVPVTYLDRPVFIAASRADEVLPFGPVRAFAAALREAGASVLDVPHDSASHAGMLAAGHPSALAFGLAHLAAEAAAIEVAAHRFDLLDQSRDGRLARDDYDAFALRLARSLGHAPRSPEAVAVREGYRRLWNAVRTAADTDGSGTVAAAEYRAWVAGRSRHEGFAAAVRPLAAAVIALVDADGDGVLDRTELARLLIACRQEPAEVERTCRALDLDGDGKVSAEELVEAVRGFCTGEDRPGAWLFGRF